MGDSLLVDISRLQFATTTLIHFVFVPLTLGLGPIVALFNTFAYRAARKGLPSAAAWDRLTRFFGAMLLINFAMGIVTGIVQEFQFGMNWSGFSEYVGGVFGGPLVMEGLLAFFLESTFLGLWTFGRGKLHPRVHLLTIWLFVAGTWASAYFILVANSWMQHPIGYTTNADGSQAIANDFGAIFTQDVAIASWLHALCAGLITASVFVIGVSAWHLKRRQHVEVMRKAWKFAIVAAIIAGSTQGLVGDWLGVIMTDKQPMKLAAAEAVWETTGPCAGFSIFAIPDMQTRTNIVDIEIPCVLSILATNSLDGTVQGMNPLQDQYAQQYGEGNYTPNVWIQFYAWRAMMGFGLIGVMWAAWAWWRTRRGRLPESKAFWTISVWMAGVTFFGSLCGWVVAENGRQPWVVYGLLKTEDAASNLNVWVVVLSLATFIVMYGAFAVVEFILLKRVAQQGPPALESHGDDSSENDNSDHVVLV